MSKRVTAALPRGRSQNESASAAVSLAQPPAWESGLRVEDAGDQPMSGVKPKVLVDASGRPVLLNDPDPDLPVSYANQLAERERLKDAGLSPSGVVATTAPTEVAEEEPAFASLPAELPAAAGFAGLTQSAQLSVSDRNRMLSPQFQRGVMNQVFGLLGLRLSRFPERVRDQVWRNIENAVRAFCEDEEGALETCLRNLHSLSDGAWGPGKTMPILVSLVACGAVLDVILEYSPLERV